MISSLLAAIADKHHLRRGNGRYSGPCPKCAGSAASDKFRIKDDGGYKCFACDFKGDIITWLREMDGMSCPEAYVAAGLECTRTSCGVRANCRMGGGTGRQAAPRVKASVTPVRAAAAPSLPLTDEKNPAQRWQDWAWQLMAKGRAAIDSQPAVIDWLAARGIDQTACNFCLGWLDHDRQVERAAIGLPAREDGKTTLWVPGGLLIPIFDACGAIHRIRIRRTNQARAKFLPDLKYVWIEGSGTSPLVLRPQAPSRGTVVVESELDAMACRAAHDEMTVIALGTVSAGLPAELRLELQSSPVILVALDADAAKAGKKGAGPAAIAAWTTLYRQARFWPLPSEKDPGEYVQKGGSLRPWLESGLPPAPVVAANAAVHDLRLSPESPHRGAGGKDAMQEAESPLDYRIITLTDGRELCVTDHEPTWHHLSGAGKIVFSQNELERLKTACSGMDAVEAANAALLAVDIKEIFGSAYIRAGRPGSGQ